MMKLIKGNSKKYKKNEDDDEYGCWRLNISLAATFRICLHSWKSKVR